MFSLYKDMYTLYYNNNYLLKCIKTSNQTQKIRTFYTDCHLQMSQILFWVKSKHKYLQYDTND